MNKSLKRRVVVILPGVPAESFKKSHKVLPRYFQGLKAFSSILNPCFLSSFVRNFSYFNFFDRI